MAFILIYCTYKSKSSVAKLTALQKSHGPQMGMPSLKVVKKHNKLKWKMIARFHILENRYGSNLASCELNPDWNKSRFRSFRRLSETSPLNLLSDGMTRPWFYVFTFCALFEEHNVRILSAQAKTRHSNFATSETPVEDQVRTSASRCSCLNIKVTRILNPWILNYVNRHTGLSIYHKSFISKDTKDTSYLFHSCTKFGQKQKPNRNLVPSPEIFRRVYRMNFLLPTFPSHYSESELKYFRWHKFPVLMLRNSVVTLCEITDSEGWIWSSGFFRLVVW